MYQFIYKVLKEIDENNHKNQAGSDGQLSEINE